MHNIFYVQCLLDFPSPTSFTFIEHSFGSQALNNLQSTYAGFGFVNADNVFKVRDSFLCLIFLPFHLFGDYELVLFTLFYTN